VGTGRKRRTDGVDRGAYRVLRELFLRRCQVEGAQCWFDCGTPMDWSLAYPHPLSASVHHVIPVGADSGINELDVNNWGCAHLRCNQIGAAYDGGAEDSAGVPDTGVESEPW
jgi:hypothetical protein